MARRADVLRDGGKRLYIARTFVGTQREVLTSPPASPLAPLFEPGVAIAQTVSPMWVSARFPGAAGNMPVRITLTAGNNVFAVDGAVNAVNSVRGVADNDLVLIDGSAGNVPNQLYLAQSSISARALRSGGSSGTVAPVELESLATTTKVNVITATVTIFPVDPNIASWVYPELALDPTHRRNGSDDSLAAAFTLLQPSLGRARSVPIVMNLSAFTDGVQLAKHILSLKPAADFANFLADPKSSDAKRSLDFILEGGDDGTPPGVAEYEGQGGDPDSKFKSGLKALEDIDDISIVAARAPPRITKTPRASRSRSDPQRVISHATRMRYRIAVLDSGDKQTVGDVRDLRGQLDSTYAALYYPWITVFDP